MVVVDVVVVVVVTVVAVVMLVADDVLGVITCFTTTVGIGLFFLLSSSLMSAPENRSSFSALVSPETFFPRKSSDSTFLCDMMSSAASIRFFGFAILGVQFPHMNPLAWKIEFISYEHSYLMDVTICCQQKSKVYLDAYIIASSAVSKCHCHRLIHLIRLQRKNILDLV